MRLLQYNNTSDFTLTEDIIDSKAIPPYAILSHRWGTDTEEVTFNDLINGIGKDKPGYEKIRFCGEQARQDDLQYFWIDTCCIDKSSSAELTEAINSMFRWYQRSAKCYVYLSDVSSRTHNDHRKRMRLAWEESFRDSQWFKRGWTLQELVAPSSVDFFSHERDWIGSRITLEQLISDITRIDVKALRGAPLSEFGINERFSWADDRQTKRPEDKAYSLLGIFDVFMPLLYGEGEERARKRLQEEIQKSLANTQSDRIQREEKAEWSEEEMNCLRALRTSDYEEFKDRNPSRLDGTCEWLLRHNHYLEWQENPSSALLWVSADPGCGKSVLAKSLIDREMQATESRVNCYFFFKDDNGDQKRAVTALSALLHQLFSQRGFLVQYAKHDYKAEGHKLSELFHKLWHILIRAASDPRAGEIVCVLDALDECAESDRFRLIDALNALYKRPASGNATFQLKFLVTSRPYLDIEKQFCPTIRLHGEKESEAISREINIVIKERVSQIGQQRLLDESERSTLETELLSIPHRTYLWLKLIMEAISDEIRLSKKKLRAVVGTLPTTVEEAYDAILSRVKEGDKKTVQKLLHIIVAAIRPLTLREMNIALAIEDHNLGYEDLDIENEMRFETSTKQICGLFVSVIDQKVYLIHQTARSYLIAKNEMLTGRWKHSLLPAESDLVMAKTCIAYLMFDVFSSTIDHKTATSAHSYLDYAASFWAMHFRRAQNIATMEMLQSVHTVCNPGSERFQNWFQINWNVAHAGYQVRKFPSELMVSSYFGHDRVVRELLSKEKCDVEIKDEHGCTSLMCAAENGHDAVVKLLLGVEKINVNVKDANGLTAFMYAAENGHRAVIKLMLGAEKIDINEKGGEDGQTALMTAAANGHEAVVKLLLGVDKIDVNAKDMVGCTALMLAALDGHDDVVKLLLEVEHIDVNAKDANSWTAFTWAAMNDCSAVVKTMLSADKVDVNAIGEDNWTALKRAAAEGNASVVELMLGEDRVDANATGDDGWTALMWAAKNGEEAVVNLMLGTDKVDINKKDKEDNWTALIRAATNGHSAVVRLLLIADKIDVNARDAHDRTALMMAALYGHDTTVKLMLDTEKVNVNAKDEYGWTAFMWASMNGHDAVVELMLGENRVAVDAICNDGWTALMWAAKIGREAVVHLMLAADKINVNARDEHGRTALMMAAIDGHVAVVKLMLDTGKVDVNAKDEYGWTAFIWAATSGQDAVVELMLGEDRVDVNVTSDDGWTALRSAAVKGHESVIKAMLSRERVEVNAKDESGYTALGLAAESGHDAVVRLLLDAEPDHVNIKG